MCGIVGYVGVQDPKDIIVNGLKKLEYRGYDSAGVAIFDKGSFRRIRATGKLKEIEDKLKNEFFEGFTGIGHTRWATHGIPSERNAHPHQVGDVTLVHNGIIENYLEIKKELMRKGAIITSDTDSELVAHLISMAIEKTQDLLKAVLQTLKVIRGAYSILVVWAKDPDHLIAFKNGPPMVIGVNKNETFVASDVQALIQYTQNFLYVADNEIASIKKTQIKFYSDKGVATKTPSEVILNWSPELVEKQGFAHYMLKEIYEQPVSVSAAMSPHISLETCTVRFKHLTFGGSDFRINPNYSEYEDYLNSQTIFRRIEHIFIIACGTSYYSAIYAKYVIESLAKIPVTIDIASEFRYRQPIIYQSSLVINVSQSGETADTLAALRMAKEKGAWTLSLCNVPNSSIDRESDGHMYMNAGPEIGVASTKAFTSSLTLLGLLGISLSSTRLQISYNEEYDLVRSWLSLPSKIEQMLKYDKYILQITEELKKYKGFIFMGRGVSYSIAMEGALKIKELAYVFAEGYAAGEMKHGPLALIDPNMLVVIIAPQDHLYEKTISNLQEVRARNGHILSIGTEGDSQLEAMSDYFISMPKSHWMINPVLSVIPLQLLAYHMSNKLGHDVDQPRNLAKSVTVE